MNNEQINSVYEVCLISMISNKKLLSADAVRMSMSMLGFDVQEFQKDFDLINLKLETYFNTDQNQAHVLDDQEIKPWLHTVDSNEYYSERYYNYLRTKEQLPDKVINIMKITNRDILERLGNPNEDLPFRRQGLVVGNVQSGKTANYLSLINLAADYGYKLIILITGIHNNLRSQTQKRVNKGFIGCNSETQEYVGVGGIKDRNSKEFELVKSNKPHCLTTVADDFNGKIRALNAVSPENAKTPIIMVVKKNHVTLKNIIEWLRDNEEGKRFNKAPALIIDDEADNASINTSKKPNETTKINSQIREILNLFHQGSYIGYTATPFANIFIDHEDKNKDLDEDLFPKDFIFTLEAPSNYLGATKFFLNDDGEPNYDSSFVEFIDDNNETIPLKKPKDFIITELPQSLINAVYEYLVSIVIKGIRPVSNKHTSMLINVSHKVQEQKTVLHLISQLYEEIKGAVKYLGGKAQAERMLNHHLKGLHNKYLPYSNECEVDRFFEQLQKVIESVKVRVINSKTDDKLDYDNYDDGLNVIAIGGYSLSRGFTLEGLTISYLIRNTAMGDTLLQMGRWFGYRDKYDDLCKLYVTDASFEWYAFIAQSIQELDKEFIIMEQNGFKPSQYGLKVRSSNTGLLITARNKMHHTDEMRLSENFSEEAYTLRGISLGNLDKQRKSFEDFSQSITKQYGKKIVFSHEKNKVDDKFYLVNDVSVDKIISILSSYEYSIDDMERKNALITYIRDREEEVALWDIALHKSFLGEEGKSQVRTFAQSCYQSDHVKTADGGGRILRPWEEAFGLTEEQYEKAEKERVKSGVTQTARFFRKNRNKPLLVLKSLDLKQSSKGEKSDGVKFPHVPAFAISFPESANTKTVSYTVNKVFINDYFGDENEIDEELEE